MKFARNVKAPGSPLRFVWLFTVLIAGIFLLNSPADVHASEHKPITLWITADIEGYLVGCDCPSGDSAGLSAMAIALKERNPETEFLLDAGGFREPLRSDPLLEGFMDDAALMLEYSAMLAVSGDLRDGTRTFNRRVQNLPITVAGSVEDRRLFQKLAGEDDVLQFGETSSVISLVGWSGTGEQVLIETESEKNLSGREPSEILNILKAAETDYRILVIRGGLVDLESFIEGAGNIPADLVESVDIVFFTGPESPAYDLPNGGDSGYLNGIEGTIPWISLAPRGNGLARVTLSTGTEPEIDIRSLVRGESPESPAVLAMGDSFMDELIASALAAANGAKATRRKVEAPVVDIDVDHEVTYWYPFGCKSCDNFLWNDIPAMERSSGLRVSVLEKNTGDPDDFDELSRILSENGVELHSIPVMFVENRIFQGDEEIKSGLSNFLEGDSSTNSSGDTGKLSKVRWEPGAIFLAGLLDGVNPCAFSAMVFLISALAMAGRSRSTMLAIGLFYALGIFVTYSLVGAGLLGGLRRIAVESGLRAILEYLLAGFLIVLSVLSLVDGLRLSRGRTDLLLKLPQKLSGRIHKLIRDEVRSGAAAGGALLLGVVVALIELGCTGQVYLPTIAWMIARGEGSKPWLWLAIYNLAFIIPLLIVFVVSYKGVSAVKLAASFRKRGAAVKYAMAGLLAVLAIVVFIT